MRRFHLEHCHPVLAEIPCWLHFEADCFEASPPIQNLGAKLCNQYVTANVC